MVIEDEAKGGGDDYPQEKFDSTKDRSLSLGVLKDNFKEIP